MAQFALRHGLFVLGVLFTRVFVFCQRLLIT